MSDDEGLNNKRASSHPTSSLGRFFAGNEGDGGVGGAGGMSVDGSHISGAGTNAGASVAGARKQKKQVIAEWPYDDYHVVQTRYYQALDEAKQDEEAAAANGTGNNANNNPFMTRPPDLVDIPTAVQNLPLADFSKTAEQRAIGIISTWIFDSGLIDDLTSPSTTMAAAAAAAAQDAANSGGDANGGAAAAAPLKMDKEIVKLRETTLRELALINNRLNDGVAASGSEVQELVHAVQTTKGNLSRLRELTQAIAEYSSSSSTGVMAPSSTTAAMSDQQEESLTKTNYFLLKPYTRLKTAIHARRNLHRCFRELDFFGNIPSTCQRLREELWNCEYQVHEWSTIRDVCREHVELQLFLVEAEAGMKARLMEDMASGNTAVEYDHYGNAILPSSLPSSKKPHAKMKKRGNSFRYEGTHDPQAVDRFLNEHVKNVWELGDEIRLRVLSGIGSAFELAKQNPMGMVALVEAVEYYENAADEFKRVHHGLDPTKTNTTGKHSNSITEMRKLALEQVAEDFEVKAKEVFQSSIDKAETDHANSAFDELEVAQFNAILRAANSLTYQIELVQQAMSPCFPSFWNIETLWLTCVAAVCSEYILEKIGGPDGNDLYIMSAQQLLDLVAWIESFVEKVQEIFPIEINSNSRKGREQRKQAISIKELMKGKEIDLETAKENLSWVTNVLWDVQELAREQFIERTRIQTQEWLDNVYHADHAKTQTNDGRLTTSLPEDLFALAGVQLRTIRERLTKKSSVLVGAVTIVFTMMQLKQREMRDEFLKDLETCCAAANDFVRMTDQCDEIMTEMMDNTDLPEESQQTLEDIANELMIQYSNDAVYAAQSIHTFIFDSIEEELLGKLFQPEWETNTSNEYAMTVVRTIEDFMGDVEEFMEEIMVRKAVDGLVKASINFYMKLLAKKAGTKQKETSTNFNNGQLSVQRINGDITAIRGYFEGLVEQFPALQRVILQEFEIVKNIFGVLYIAANDEEASGEGAEEIFYGIQKTIKNVDITRLFIGDLYHLVRPEAEKRIYEVFAEHEAQLKAFELTQEHTHHVQDQFIDKGLQLDQVLIETVSESTRKRPIKGETLKSMEKAFGNWGWGGGGNDADDGDANQAGDTNAAGGNTSEGEEVGES